MNRIIGAVGALAVFALLGGCATTRSATHLTIPQPGAVVTQTSPRQVVIDTVEDTRDFQVAPSDPSTPSLKRGQQYEMDATQRETAIGRKRNTWGKAMGDWVLEDGQTVNSITRDLIATTLRSLGYQVENTQGDSNATHVRVAIKQFWAWFTPGMWTATIEAKVQTQLQFSGPDGNKSIVVNGYGRNQVQTGREANWQLAYDRAFMDYEKNLRGAVTSSSP